MSTYFLALAFFFFTSLWVWLDAPNHGMTRWWGMGALILWIVFFPLYLVLRATSDHAEVGDGPRPQLLANGDILVPITDDGRTRMVRLEPGEEEHAEWFGYIQTGRW